MSKVYFVTGACGVGKSTLLPILRKMLPSFDIHDFDELGVPEHPGIEWRIATTLHWLEVAKAKANVSTIILGLTIPQEVEALAEPGHMINYCLLDLSRAERARRLTKRAASHDLIEDTEELVGLREWIKQTRFPHTTIDTTKKTPQQVARLLFAWIRSVDS